jgi:hypothetical protein
MSFNQVFFSVLHKVVAKILILTGGLQLRKIPLMLDYFVIHAGHELQHATVIFSE